MPIKEVKPNKIKMTEEKIDAEVLKQQYSHHQLSSDSVTGSVSSQRHTGGQSKIGLRSQRIDTHDSTMSLTFQKDLFHSCQKPRENEALTSEMKSLKIKASDITFSTLAKDVGLRKKQFFVEKPSENQVTHFRIPYVCQHFSFR